MEFLKLGKYVVAVVSVVGVIGLIYRLFVEGNFGAGETIGFTHEFGRLNLPRFFLIAWEMFWLTSIAVFFIYVAKRAKTEKTEEEIARLENFEPKLFRIVIALLVIAAFLTLVLPIFFGQNTLVQYNVDEEVDPQNEIEMRAAQFVWTIEGDTCQVDVSCFTFETGIRYKFMLTSADTTHGFALYDDNYILLTQAQIVPGYTTQVAFTFTDSGEYTLRCAEYCGQAHHDMVATLTVVDGGN